MLLHTKPNVYIEDIDVFPTIESNRLARVSIRGKLYGLAKNQTARVSVSVWNQEEVGVFQKTISIDTTGSSSNNFDDDIDIYDPVLWWPRGMDPNPGHMYTLEVYKQ